MQEIIIATHNQGKLNEFQALFSPVHCISQQSLNIPPIEETGLSFIENALIKARHVSLLSNKPALADDSGLVVPALNGEPGIYSARYAGHHASDSANIQHLLKKLEPCEDSLRHAFFYCAIAFVQYATDPTPLIAYGKIDGRILLKPSGVNGFGYDPIFYLPSYNCSMAELPLSLKNKISHRAQALKKLHKQLLSLGL